MSPKGGAVMTNQDTDNKGDFARGLYRDFRASCDEYDRLLLEIDLVATDRVAAMARAANLQRLLKQHGFVVDLPPAMRSRKPQERTA